MTIKLQLTARVLSVQQTVGVCTLSEGIRRREGPLLKVAMQTANLSVNSHFLWPGFEYAWLAVLIALFFHYFLAFRVN